VFLSFFFPFSFSHTLTSPSLLLKGEGQGMKWCSSLSAQKQQPPTTNLLAAAAAATHSHHCAPTQATLDLGLLVFMWSMKWPHFQVQNLTSATLFLSLSTHQHTYTHTHTHTHLLHDALVTATFFQVFQLPISSSSSLDLSVPMCVC
jgi:hypothetical protein